MTIKKTLIFFSILILIVLTAVNAFLLMPPTAAVKRVLVDEVRKASGLDLEIGGRVGLRLLPSVSLKLDDAVLSNPANGPSQGQGLVTARSVEVTTAFWPLLAGRYEIERVTLIEPRVLLTVDEAGRGNWMPQPSAPRALRLTSTEPAASRPVTSSPALASVVFSGGTLDYRDARDGTVLSIRDAAGSATGVTETGFASAALTSGNLAAGRRAATPLTVSGLSGTAQGLVADKLAQFAIVGSALNWLHEGTAVAADQVSVSAGNLSPASASALAVSSASLTWNDAKAGNAFNAKQVSLKAGELSADGLKAVVLVSAGLDYVAGGPTKAGSKDPKPPVVTLADVSIAAPAVTLASAIPADVAFVWNKERVSGKAVLPALDALALGLAMGPASGDHALPVTVALTSAQGKLDFEGGVGASAPLRAKGKTTATAPSIADLAKWLGVELPAGLTGPAAITGDIDTAGQRIALTNGRIEHGGTVMSGALTLDTAGARPMISGKVSSDKFDANRTFGLTPSAAPANTPSAAAQPTQPTVPIKDSLKAYMRAMLASEPSRSGLSTDVSLEDLTRSRAKRSAIGAADLPDWSDKPIDMAALRTVDFDLEVAVKSLTIGAFDISVPRLKANLRGGELALEGDNLSTRGGKLTGKAQIDARQAIPHVAASFMAEGVDVYDLLGSIGVTALISGTSNVEADLTGSGSSQKQLVETLSGRVKARIGQGEIVGYDFSSIMNWLFGDRVYDPSQRTRFDSLDANVAFDNGVSRDSTVQLTGPIVGGSADGTIRLPDKEIDYRARFKLASFFSALSLRIFGEWDKPSVTPDLDLFSRGTSRDAAGSLMSPLEMLGRADLEDAELASLIGQVLDKAGPRGLPPQVADTLRVLQSRAQGARR